MGKRTQLYEYHAKHGKIVDYAGYDLPVWFEGIIPECKTVRNYAGLFDVSHMGRVLVEGSDATRFLDDLTTNDVSALENGRGQYSLLCNPKGGVIDDLTIFRLSTSKFLVVYNAANRDKDWNWLQHHRGSLKVLLSDVSDKVAMFAVQGPRAGTLLKSVSGARLDEVEKYGTREVKIADAPCLLTRSGYTGEDGFEAYVWNATVENPVNAVKVWDSVLREGRDLNVRPAGLGARDVLRLEAGMCLYGNDLDENTSPVEAKLGWVIRVGKSNFVGKEAILKIRKSGPTRVRIGFRMKDKGIPRQGQEILSEDIVIGKVTSGTFSPTLGVGIGMGFVKREHARLAERLMVRIRDRDAAAEVAKLPFYQRRSDDRVVVFGEEMGVRDFKTKFRV